MKTSGSFPRSLAIAAVIAVLAVPVSLAAEEVEGGRIKGYVPPPTELKKLGEGHWTPYDPPVPPEDERVHVVQPGDTLWDLAMRYYEDNYLWPVIWDANRYVTYSHWIYPGDPLVIPPNPTVIPPEPPVPPEPEPVAQAGEPEPTEPTEPAEPAEPAEPVPTGPVLMPVADTAELLCAGAVVPEYEAPTTQLVGTEHRSRTVLGVGDIVYLNAGLSAGVEPGASFTVVRSAGEVQHPDSDAPFGTAVEWLGRIEVLAVQQDTATAEIVISCQEIDVGDHVIPYEEIAVPVADMAGVDPYTQPQQPAGPTGMVFHSKHGLDEHGDGHVVSVDLGSARGAQPGDQLLFYRERGRLPRTILGSGVVLRTTSIASTVKITQVFREVRIGDLVEMR